MASAFGVFEPGLVVSLYDAAREACGLAEVRAATRLARSSRRAKSRASRTRRRLGCAASSPGPTRRPGDARRLAALPWPADPLGQLWHACTILREHRGDGHLAACVTAGLNGLQANLLTELLVGWEPFAYTASRGWSPEAMQAGMASLEARGLVAGGALNVEGRRLHRSWRRSPTGACSRSSTPSATIRPALVETLDGWSQRIIDKALLRFPPDPHALRARAERRPAGPLTARPAP